MRAADRPATDVHRAIVTAVEALKRDADEVAMDTAVRLEEAVDEIHADDETRRDSQSRGRETVIAFCDWVVERKPPEEFGVPRTATGFARILARRGIPVSTLLRIHRLALGYLLEALEQRLDRDEDKSTLLDASSAATEMAFACHDVLTARVCEEYERERERWTRGARAQRREAVEVLLSDTPVDTDHASKALMYELRRYHVGLVAWAPDDDNDPESPAPALASAATRVARELGCFRPLLLTRSSHVLWVWFGSDSPPPQETLERLAHICLPDKVRVAIGECAHGVTGFRTTHCEAVDAARVATLAGRRPGSITTYRSVELAALMAWDLPRTQAFVRDQLGPLSQNDDEHTRLRVTLMLYLEEHGSRIATARRLGIHPNTVANRIRSCRDLLDRDLTNRQVHLQVALALASTLGSAVLVASDD